MTERLVIAPLLAGVVADGPLHDPAPYKLVNAGLGRAQKRMTFEFAISQNDGIPPFEWPSRCGRVGVVYAKGGAFEHRAMCPDCVTADVVTVHGSSVPDPELAAIVHGTLHGYSHHGCRCPECRQRNTDYTREWRRKRRAAA